MDSAVDRRVLPLSPRGLEAARDLKLGAPRLDQFLLGRTHAYGAFEDFTGRVRRRFAVDLEGSANGKGVEAIERFVFDDGERETRVWRIWPEGEGRYAAAADDLIGEARGAVDASRLAWSYLFLIKFGRRRVKVRYHESFVMLGPDVMLNTARVSKFGFTLGRVTILFQRGPLPTA